MCTVQQETPKDLQYALCLRLVAVPCCHLIFMPYIFKHYDLPIPKIISVEVPKKNQKIKRLLFLCAFFHTVMSMTAYS